MFLCRTGRLSAGALGHTFKCPGSFLLRIDASGPGDVTQTARTGLSFQRYRLLYASVGGLDPTRAHLGKPKPDPVQNWDATLCGCVSSERGRSDRAAAGAVSPPAGVQRQGGELDHSSRCRSTGDTRGVALFTGDCGRSRRCFTSTIMQLRASSTSAATTKSEERADGDKVEASSTSAPEKSLEVTPEPEGGKPSKTQQLKKVFKEYGAVGVSFHIAISLMSLGMFYLLISSGIDMGAMLCKLGFSEAVVQSKMAAGTSTFVLAYAIHKLFAPVRISITLVSVPLIVRYLRKTGLFKPPTPAP
ncbi:protein FAM210B, mitochondrial [Xenentodon cancila]